MKQKNTTIEAFGIFQGGGAQGVTHIGAYLSAHEAGIKFIGVAGASAGAIVAALIAVGCTPQEIIDREKTKTDPNRDILSKNGLSPISILGANDWASLQKIISLTKHASGILLLSFLWFTLSTFLIIYFFLRTKNGWPDFALIALWSALTAGILAYALPPILPIRRMIIERGIIDPKNVEKSIEKVLQKKVAEQYKRGGVKKSLPEKITFRDIDPDEFPRCGFSQLKVAVTDITDGRLRIFGLDTFPDASIAEVVTASISIPLIFKPAKISTVSSLECHDFVDGGLVSNLPVWAFAEEKSCAERRRYPFAPIPILAFSLQDRKEKDFIDTCNAWRSIVGVGRKILFGKEKLMFRSHLIHTIRTGIFSSQRVSHEFIPDLHVFSLTSSLKTLDFDATWKDIREGFSDGFVERSKIRAPIFAKNKVSGALEDIYQAIIADLNKKNAQGWRKRIRLLVFQPVGRTSFKVTHHHNLQDDVDDRLTLDQKCPGVPQAFTFKGPLGIARGDAHSSPAHCKDLPMSKYEFVHMWRDWKSAICIPLFADALDYKKSPENRAVPIAVLSIDSDDDIMSLLTDDASLSQIVEKGFNLSTFLCDRKESMQ